MKRVGLALGGGGVRGLAHIRVLQLLDELDVRPARIAGCSMGAIVGALYASGFSGREIWELVDRHTLDPESGGPREYLRQVAQKGASILHWLASLKPSFRRGGLLDADRFLTRVLEPIAEQSFEDLEVPLIVVATDFWTGREVVFDSGSLAPALHASIAIPGIFAPYVRDGQVLVDGGLSNQVPYDHLLDACDLTIAVDVAAERYGGGDGAPVPHSIEMVLRAFDMLQAEVFEARLASRRPDLMVQPRIRDVDILDFNRVREVLDQVEPSIETLRSDLERLLR